MAPSPATSQPAAIASVEDASGVDDDGLAGHGLGAAHGNHHVGAVVLVGGLLQERARRGALDLLGAEISRRARALEQARDDDRVKAVVISVDSPGGEVTASDDTATIARIGEALARGEIAAANTLIGKLSASTAPTYAAWKARLETRAKAFEALAALRAAAVADLAKIAASVK